MTSVAKPGRKEPADGRLRSRLITTALLLPTGLWYLVLLVLPLIIIVIFSFGVRAKNGGYQPAFVLDNYLRAIDKSEPFVTSLQMAIGGTIGCLLVGLPLAYFLATRAGRRKSTFVLLLVIPFWTSFLIRTYAWITILSTNGLLNGFLEYTKLIEEPFGMLYTPGAVVLGLVYSYLPFLILPVYGSVEKLDNSLVEAAFDLGAGPLRAFQSVILPLTRPGVIAGVLLVFIPAIGMFAISQLMGGGATPTIGEVIQNQFMQARDWPFGAALGMTLLVLFAVAFWLTSRRQGVEEA